MKNGGDALALTDHGNMNGFSHQFIYAEKLRKAGKDFKAIHGVEAYFVPSLSNWKALYDAERAAKASAPKKSKAPVRGASPEAAMLYSDPILGDDMASTEAELDGISEIKKAEIDNDDSGGTIVENEEESKGVASKYRNPLYQRNHLVLLAKNDAGLKSLFRIVSDSAADGFYRYPRVDLDMLRKYSNGNIIATTACLEATACLLTNFGEKNIQEVVTLLKNGEEVYVLGYNEVSERVQFGKVVWGDCTRKAAKTVTIRLANGKSIRCTPDHKFLTKDGWKTALELKTGRAAILTVK
jgi:DNA polymerase III alpha subunit